MPGKWLTLARIDEWPISAYRSDKANVVTAVQMLEPAQVFGLEAILLHSVFGEFVMRDQGRPGSFLRCADEPFELVDDDFAEFVPGGCCNLNYCSEGNQCDQF